ncbi:protein kinase C-binding protein NELL2-like isoform X2 [Aethina tumida]|uniref:protein kinase C-binding protein NELL2-like isoform X2 n=1 Tax=Aethina tumida TaxID=116153 RepID=UPI002147F133|nr:protein kinase C-binding protein NELL2-like isoform X2 [Aethina tumida]
MASGLPLAVWTTLLWLASATGLDPTGLFQSGAFGATSQSIDLLAALGLHNSTWAGVTLAPGQPQLRPVYDLQGDLRDLRLPAIALQQVSELLRRSPEFTIAAWLRQEVGNTGTIVAISHGVNRYLEVQSSGRKNEIRLHYTSRLDSKVYVEAFPFKLADNVWHQVAVSVSGSQVELIVDCHPLYKRLMRPGAPDRNLTMAHQIWLGQRNQHFHFKGAMQDVRLIGGPHGYLSQCPRLDSSCPTCGQFSLLQNTVQELTRHLQELSERLVAAEGRITALEDCDCQKSCHHPDDGTIHADGATWQRNCDLCSCVHGKIECHPVECPEVHCKHPVKLKEECCHSCLKHCFLNGQFFDHGEVVTVKKCVECECKDGFMGCNRIDPKKACPKLNCPPEKQFSEPDSCCKFCPDIDECKQEGGLEGHHCNHNTRCVNTPGSYKCECLEGYRPVDKFNCVEEDECSTSKHRCDENADCINTQGSYHCVCKEGYQGDGYTCQAVCNQTCLNGGICTSPGKCRCPNGYTGKSCEWDVDECKLNLHRCTDISECVNLMGWYYCKCKEGYQSRISTTNLGTLCEDINECKDNLHTCHPSAQCVNTNGHYRCECKAASSNTSLAAQPPSDCRLSCVYGGVEVADGARISPPLGANGVGKCEECVCERGVMQCEKPACDCSAPGASEDECCPQCIERYSCKHQEIKDVVLSHGQQWSYQCQTCECEYGEVDCWDMKCPPLLCSNPVTSPGDCCPHCGDPCPLVNVTGSGQQCVYMDRMYESGAQFTDPNDTCVTCNCKDGALCCSYTNYCGDDQQPVGFDGVVANASPAATGRPPSSQQSGRQYTQRNPTTPAGGRVAVGGEHRVGPTQEAAQAG